MYLWCDNDDSSDTLQPWFNFCMSILHIIRCKTFCLTLVINVDAFSLFWTSGPCVRYSQRLFPLWLVSKLLYTVWCALASFPIKSSSFCSEQYSTSSLNSASGGFSTESDEKYAEHVTTSFWSLPPPHLICTVTRSLVMKPDSTLPCTPFMNIAVFGLERSCGRPAGYSHCLCLLRAPKKPRFLC